jgi:D-3-phosphoglycerate dehydrogenase
VALLLFLKRFIRRNPVPDPTTGILFVYLIQQGGKDMKIMVSDKLPDQAVDRLKRAGHEVLIAWDEPKENLPNLIGEYDALVIRSATKARGDLLDAATNLKVIGRAGIGLDNVDLDTCKERGIKVVNTPLATTVSVAELTILHMLASVRDIVTGTVTTKEGKWEKSKLGGNELFGKTLGILGIGRIGQAVGERAKAFGMNIIAYDAFAECRDYEMCDIERVFKESDFISIHAPLTPQTKHLIDADVLAMMKDGVVILNISRGGIIDEDALYDAMKSGKVKAACLDSFETEPPEGSKLLELPNLICTPHIGAQTAEGQLRAGIQVMDNVMKALEEE